MKKLIHTVSALALFSFALLPYAAASGGAERVAPTEEVAAGAQAPAPAPACGRCGDGYCAPQCGETATSCPKDCGGTSS